MRTIGVILLVLFSGAISFGGNTDLLNPPKIEQREWQRAIDDSLFHLMQSNFGLTLAQRVLNCKKEDIENHLGLSELRAEQISNDCHVFTDNLLKYPFIVHSPPSSLKKVTLSGEAFKKRTYEVILSKRDNWLFDSWTHPTLNKTSIIMREGTESIAKDDPRLLRILAHETAIYFDSKFWTSSVEFQRLARVKRFLNSYSKNDLSSFFLVVDNPLIAFVLSSQRAFLIEDLWLNDLGIEISGSLYVGKACEGNCLVDFILNQSTSFLDLTLPFLAYAPHYRSLFWSSYENLKAMGIKQQFESTIESTLLTFPGEFFREFKDREMLAVFETQTWRESHKYRSEYVGHIYEQIILPLSANRLSKDPELLKFLFEPLMSGYNIRLSAGPRPRIIIGGGQ